MEKQQLLVMTGIIGQGLPGFGAFYQICRRLKNNIQTVEILLPKKFK